MARTVDLQVPVARTVDLQMSLTRTVDLQVPVARTVDLQVPVARTALSPRGRGGPDPRHVTLRALRCHPDCPVCRWTPLTARCP